MDAVARSNLSPDFRRFWTGQTISQLGSSFTEFALPLLVFKLTGSAINLGVTSAAEMLPYLLFGLVIGAWVDRLNRKRMMIVVDVLRAVVVATIPLLAALHVLSVWHIYAVGFVSSTLTIFFQSGEFAAIPSLVETDDLVTANGRIQASYSAAQVMGPLLAGAMITVVPVQTVMLIDAASFLVSAYALGLIGRSFNAEKEEGERTTIRQDVLEGLRYVLRHPVLRNISAMMSMVNFFTATVFAQLVFFSKVRLHATDPEVGWLFAAGSGGVVVLSLAAGRLRKRWPFSRVALGSLMVYGISMMALAFTRLYWLALPLWALCSGVGILFNINTGSLRQAIVPSHLLGRVISIAGVLAWSAIPLGALLGGFVVHWTGDVALVYGVIGVSVFAIAFTFLAFSPLGHAERYLPQAAQSAAVTGNASETGAGEA
jgi:MFS family permease